MDKDMMFVRTAAMRYMLQEWEVHVPLPGGEFDDKALETVSRDFHRCHKARYGYSREERAVEFVTLFLHSIAVAPPLHYEKKPAGPADSSKAEKGRREVYIDQTRRISVIPVYERGLLSSGNLIEGPAIIEEPIATTYVHPGWKCTIEEMGNMIITPIG